MAKILMFSIATNGYDFGYQHCIASHKAYADVVLDLLDPKREIFELRLYRDSCIKT